MLYFYFRYLVISFWFGIKRHLYAHWWNVPEFLNSGVCRLVDINKNRTRVNTKQLLTV